MTDPIAPEDLAEKRGCAEWNDCWPECVEAARRTIDEEGETDG